MAKLSRSALKGLVKECLVEILSEGIGNPSSQASNPNTLVRENKKRELKKPRRKSSLDQMMVEEKNSRLVNSLAGNDSIMKDIFADTLKNNMTALSQESENNSNAQRMVHGDGATKQMLNSDPMALFEGANNWEALAFAGGDKS